MDYKISIPKPCHENWGSMTPDEKGRFCSMCQKTVVDFTGKPKPEIVDYLLANADKKVCGRFGNEQLDSKPLNVTIPKSVFFNQTNFYRMFLLALFITMGSTLFSCKNDTTIGDVIVEDTVITDTTETRHTVGITTTDIDIPVPDAQKVQEPDPSALPKPVNRVNTKLQGEVAPLPNKNTTQTPPPACTTGDVIVEPVKREEGMIGKVSINPKGHEIIGDTIVAPD